MRLAAPIFALALSTASIASPSEWVFHGHGEYKNSLGEASEYSVTTNKTMTADNTYTVIKNVVAENGEAMTFAVKIVKDDLGMIEVQNLDGDVIGSGYYFKDYAKKMMHIEYETLKGSVEKTIVADLDGYKEIGSAVKNEDQSKSVWCEKGHRVFPIQ